MLTVLQRIVREVNSATSLDEALGIIVRRIKEAMSVDVCSVYLIEKQRKDYVLLASDGLDKGAIGKVRLGSNEGLVGLVGERQEPLLIKDAPAHPRYRYFPNTGEEQYRAFLGTPIIHYREVMGVLVVQRREASDFTDDDVALLVTIAAQLAGAINHATLDGSIASILNRESPECHFVKGLPGASGVAVGTIVVVFPPASLEAVPDRKVTNIEAEEHALKAAIAEVQDDLRAGGLRMASVLPAEERALFDALVMLSGSDTLIADTLRRIREGNWAPAALRDTIAEHAKVFDDMEDAYLRARANDLRDIGTQILIRLQSGTRIKIEYPERTVLFGEYISVAQISEVPVERLAGIVCTAGSSLSHTAILAHALSIPTVMGLGDISLARLEGLEIVVDGYQGQVCIRPSAAVVNEYLRLAQEEQEFFSGLQELRDLPAETIDGTRLGLQVNVGLPTDMPAALKSGAEGVGLYRTEFAFMTRNTFPGEEEQYRMYRRVLMVFAPKPVSIRVLDIGGDKILPYFHTMEQNPALGWRGIRVILDHPEIFLTQLRALLRANAGLNNLKVLLPMITRVSEVDDAMDLLERAHNELLQEGQACAKPLLGVMVETPAAVYQSAALAKRSEFISLGTNDLTQHLLVVDRNNPQVANIYDHLHPAVIRVIRDVIETSHEWGKPVSVCGEMAGDPAAAILLLGMGVDNLSMTAADLARIKQVIRSFNKTRATQVLNRVLQLDDARDIRPLLTDALDGAGLSGLLRAGK